MGMQRLSTTADWPLYDNASIRRLEALAQQHSPISLMQQAGLAAAQLACAVAPHAQRIWVAAGIGHNGGDGLEAAMHLHQWGKSVMVSLMGEASALPKEAFLAWQRALSAGVPFSDGLPSAWVDGMHAQDLAIDALLGIGATRPIHGPMSEAVQALNRCAAQVLAIDLPIGLNPESGQLLSNEKQDKRPPSVVHADHTLSFIAAKPGLFMGHGRDACGQIWLANLGSEGLTSQIPELARLNPLHPCPSKNHASHKGSFGDVAIVGGEPMALHGTGMAGAAVLAATAALHAGAGRVILSLLSGHASDAVLPDLMQRQWHTLALEELHVVCGCGGGQAVRPLLGDILRRSAQLVLDADGLNALAHDPALQQGLKQRTAQQASVITPHPLEAARLLNTSTQQVQNDRLAAAQALVALFDCTVVLKGSGTVIAAPGQTPRINPSGNGLLAIGGTGDVLAGLIAARMAQGLGPFEAACAAVSQHGHAADIWPQGQALTASRLAQSFF